MVKKILNISVKVLTWILVAFTVFMMIFTVVTVTTVDKNERDIFGYKFYIVQTDSMSPSENNKDMEVHFSAGDIVIIRNCDDPTKLKAGEIISFMISEDREIMGSVIKAGSTITHMIHEVKVNEKTGAVSYVTFGTNTGKLDDAQVESQYVLGTYAGKLPGVGNFFAFVKSTPGYIICILVPFLLLILYNGVNVIRLFRQYKREQMADMQAERDKLDAERAENQRMMQELLALKAQLEKNGAAASPAEPREADPSQEISSDNKAEETNE